MATTDPLPSALVAGAAATAVALRPPTVPAPDRFTRRAGPDVAYRGPNGMTSVYALFSIDPTSHELHIALVDEDGRLLRLVPPDSVAVMVDAMGRYRPR